MRNFFVAGGNILFTFVLIYGGATILGTSYGPEYVKMLMEKAVSLSQVKYVLGIFNFEATVTGLNDFLVNAVALLVCLIVGRFYWIHRDERILISAYDPMLLVLAFKSMMFRLIQVGRDLHRASQNLDESKLSAEVIASLLKSDPDLAAAVDKMRQKA